MDADGDSDVATNVISFSSKLYDFVTFLGAHLFLLGSGLCFSSGAEISFSISSPWCLLSRF
jgi:hypothetical protein